MPAAAELKSKTTKPPQRSLRREMLAIVFVYALVFVVSLVLANGCAAERASGISKTTESLK